MRSCALDLSTWRRQTDRVVWSEGRSLHLFTIVLASHGTASGLLCARSDVEPIRRDRFSNRWIFEPNPIACQPNSDSVAGRVSCFHVSWARLHPFAANTIRIFRGGITFRSEPFSVNGPWLAAHLLHSFPFAASWSQCVVGSIK